MGSRRYPGRRHVKGWQLTALVGAAGVVVLAGCGSSGTSSPSGGSGGTSTAVPTANGASTAPGNATSGSITWSASPLSGTGANDARAVLIKAFEQQYPNIKVTLISASTDTDTNRATLATQSSGGSATPDVFMGDVIWPAQFGAHQLAAPLSDYLPASYWTRPGANLVQ